MITLNTKNNVYIVEFINCKYYCFDYKNNEVVGIWESFTELKNDCKNFGWRLKIKRKKAAAARARQGGEELCDE